MNFSMLGSRGLLVGLLAIGAVFIISFTEVGEMVQNLLYVGYGLFVPFAFGLFVLAGIYFGLRHVMTA